jgi:peptide/nickel transport system substrate-binding protein
MQNTTHSHSFFDTLKSLSPFERLFVGLLSFLTLVSGTSLAYTANESTFVEIPRGGGTYSEGIVGTPRFINPLLAISHADKDLVSIVYAGLMTRDAQGKLIPELAESYTVSEDGLVYTFTLREGLTFHDGTPITSEDVVFTVREAGNASVRSPLFANWDGVQAVNPDEQTIVFTLPEPYVPFLENLTLGILPAHIWAGLTAEEFPFSQFNITPVGSGPFRIDVVDRDKSGIPSTYKLTRFKEYALGAPFIDTIEFILYNNDEEALTAYKNGKINAINSVAPIHLEVLLNSGTKNDTSVHRAPFLRVFAVFFNHNKQPIFLRDEVRKALDVATPKKAIVGEILRGYGTLLEGPLPPYLTDIPATNVDETTSEETIEESADGKIPLNHIEQAQHILEDAGWKKGENGTYVLEDNGETIPLAVSFTTVDTPELMQTAERIAESWREVGAEVEVKVFEATDLAQSVIRPRRFDTLLFGMVVGHELDLYAFWHSSQRNDPGLNIAQYADIEADSLLGKMRTEQELTNRTTLYQEFTKLVSKNNSAIFLYAPDFIYVVDDSIRNVSIHPIAETSERFDTIHTWNIETDNVWFFLEQFFK